MPPTRPSARRARCWSPAPRPGPEARRSPSRSPRLRSIWHRWAMNISLAMAKKISSLKQGSDPFAPTLLGVAVATDEYALAKGSAVVVDNSSRTRLLLTGADVADFLQGQVSNDVEALEPGAGCYATLL